MDTLAVQLMVPTTKPIADFHRLVTAHAGQTKKIRPPYLGKPYFPTTYGRRCAQRVKYKPAKMTPAPKAWTTPKASPKNAYPAATAKTGAKLL